MQRLCRCIYNSTLSLTSALDEVGGQCNAPAGVHIYQQGRCIGHPPHLEPRLKKE